MLTAALLTAKSDANIDRQRLSPLHARRIGDDLDRFRGHDIDGRRLAFDAQRFRNGHCQLDHFIGLGELQMRPQIDPQRCFRDGPAHERHA